MTVQFVPKTHYFFSASKDKTVKYWDADKFIHVMTLDGHLSEIWCLAVSHDGEFIVGIWWVNANLPYSGYQSLDCNNKELVISTVR